MRIFIGGLIWNTLKIGILVIRSNLEFFTLHFHTTWYHSMIWFVNLDWLSNPRRRPWVHFASEVNHLDLVMVGKDDHIVAVLYHRDLAKHPNVPIQSEDSQDQRTHFFSDFAGPEAMKHQVTQNLDWQLQSMRYPPNAPELLLSKHLHVPATQLLRLVTPPPLAIQLQVLLRDQGEPSFHHDHDHDRHRPHLFLLRKYLHQQSNRWISQYT